MIDGIPNWPLIFIQKDIIGQDFDPAVRGDLLSELDTSYSYGL